MQTTAKEAFSLQAAQILHPYKERFEKELEKAFNDFGPKNKVREAMEYALQGSAKRFRPALVYMVADALKQNSDVTHCALTVEYFHVSSLIADDLPCMDDDDFRRGRPSTHKVYGEATALLASYALIASGFDEIVKNPSNDPENARIGISLASRTMGAQGLIGGQYYDLYHEKLDREEFLKIVDLKTAALFDLSMSLGWIFGGGDKKKLDLVHKAAHHFGVAFQLIDDLDDMQQDAADNCPMNYANLFGRDETIKTVKDSIEQFVTLLEQLSLDAKPLKLLGQGLKALSMSFAMP